MTLLFWLQAAALHIKGMDLWVVQQLNAVAGNWVIDHLIDFICSFRILKGGIPIAIYYYYWFKHIPGQSATRVLLVDGIVAAVVAVILARGLAHLLPVRLRPFADLGSGFVTVLPAKPADYEDWSSFPSDTSAFEFALGWSLMGLSRTCSTVLLLYTTVVACLTRLYLGVHYASDIVVGALIGILAAWVMQRVAISRFLDRSILRGEGSHPVFYSAAFLVTSEMAQVFDNLRSAKQIIVTLLQHSRETAIGLAAMLVAAGLLIGALIVLWQRHRALRHNRLGSTDVTE
jgi:undecaprenyl-diphosphatase